MCNVYVPISFIINAATVTQVWCKKINKSPIHARPNSHPDRKARLIFGLLFKELRWNVLQNLNLF